MWKSIDILKVSHIYRIPYKNSTQPLFRYKTRDHLIQIQHRFTTCKPFFSGDEDKKTLEKEIFGAEMIPEAQTYLTFWEKFLELQIKMLITNQENVQNHNYASDPSEWPFLTRGIAYFISKESNVGLKSSKSCTL